MMQFWAAFAATYPNITIDKQNLDYNQMLDKIAHRRARQRGAVPRRNADPVGR